MSTNALDWALYMASLGYQVWPVHLQLRRSDLKKQPRGQPDGWTRGGLTDPDAIRVRWAQVGATGYLIVCGPSGVTGVDTDRHDGCDGEANWLAAGGPDCAAFVVRSWSGGKHRYYSSTGAASSRGNPPGVDVRGIGGGLFGPGSVVLNPDGTFAGAYSVLTGSAVREALTPEPANLAAITGVDRALLPGNDADDFFNSKPPVKRSRVIAVCKEAIERVRAMTGEPGSGMGKTIEQAAFPIGGLLHTGQVVIEDVREALMLACDHVFGKADAEDEAWIDRGLRDGQRKPLVVYDDTAPAGGNLLATQPHRGEIDDRFVDLRPFLDGTYTPPEATVGARRSDGVFLMYPERWHVLGGLNASGKTWFAARQAIAEMLAGNLVVYLHFEEPSPAGTLDRVHALGASAGLDDDTILKQFHWLRCDRRWAAGELSAKLAKLDRPPTLVILDGINAAVGQHQGDVQRTESVGQYRELFVTPSAAVGAAALSLGHPVKDRSRQEERHTFGSTAWLDEVDGVGFRLEASKNPIGRGRSGSSALYSVKDRYGQVERYGEAQSGREPGWFYLGQLVVDDSEAGGTSAWVTAPRPHGGEVSTLAEPKEASDDRHVYEVVCALLAADEEANLRTVRAAATGLGKDRVDNSLTRLRLSRSLTETSGPRGARIFSLPTVAGDQLDEQSE